MKKITLQEGLEEKVSLHWLLTPCSGVGGGWRASGTASHSSKGEETLERAGWTAARWGKCACVCTCKNVAEAVGVKTSPNRGQVVRCPSDPHPWFIALLLWPGSAPLLLPQDQMAQSPQMEPHCGLLFQGWQN